MQFSEFPRWINTSSASYKSAFIYVKNIKGPGRAVGKTPDKCLDKCPKKQAWPHFDQ